VTGLAAFALARGAETAAQALTVPQRSAARLGGAILCAAGIYQFTPWKAFCLARCGHPVGFIMRSWRGGLGGAFRMGLLHGLYCLGCCWLLFAILFPLGMMNIVAMAAITLLILAEKTLPQRRPAGSPGPHRCAGLRLDLHLHHPLGRESQHLTDQITVRRLLYQLHKRHLLLGHRQVLLQVQCRNRTLTKTGDGHLSGPAPSYTTPWGTAALWARRCFLSDRASVAVAVVSGRPLALRICHTALRGLLASLLALHLMGHLTLKEQTLRSIPLQVLSLRQKKILVLSVVLKFRSV